MPSAWHASAVSIAYSVKIVGWLYVNGTLLAPASLAAREIASGLAESTSRSISRDFEMSQFWQNLHARLQPAVPNDSTLVPGWKWLSGFFSIGSSANPLERPY